ncbi:hypothetical protein DVA86_26335 [Streptomyces armeniacus]|uniref:Uncharacterized protein n=1 Tax=Streptomyces armeniacus TaxID=83291 RepID=A0A345XVG4_9ACTN|nr:hypothetical protein [Streptomyces armeniacus]AXK35630.1 hypothetical protein DVA86_26335 [Streptomyces armeniacus]
MDTEAAAALVSVAARSVATSAGQSAWTSLVSLVRRTLGREAEPATPEDSEAVRVLEGRLVERAGADPEFARQLCEWAEAHRELLPDGGAVHNTIGGDACVHGPVIQARDIHGDISFG